VKKIETNASSNLRALGLEEGVHGVVRGRRAVPPHGVLLALASQVGPVAVAAGGVRRRSLHLIDLCTRNKVHGLHGQAFVGAVWCAIARPGTGRMCRGF
jgi:hypothetical protein